MSPFYVSCNVSPLSYCTTDIHELFTTIACLQHENETLNQQNAFLRKQIEDFQRQIMSLKEMNGIVPGLLRATEHQSENPLKDFIFEDYDLCRRILDDLKYYCFKKLELKDAETYRASGEKLPYKVYLQNFVNKHLNQIIQDNDAQEICHSFEETSSFGSKYSRNGSNFLQKLFQNPGYTTEDLGNNLWNSGNEIFWSFFISDLISDGKVKDLRDLQSEMWNTTPFSDNLASE